MGPTWRQLGVGWFMSRTYAVLTAGMGGASTSPGVPDLRTCPGRYMTALPPGTGTGSIMVQVWVARSRAWVVVLASSEPAYSTRPSGSWNMYGYSGIFKAALVSMVHELAVGE